MCVWCVYYVLHTVPMYVCIRIVYTSDANKLDLKTFHSSLEIFRFNFPHARAACHQTGFLRLENKLSRIKYIQIHLLTVQK